MFKNFAQILDKRAFFIQFYNTRDYEETPVPYQPMKNTLDSVQFQCVDHQSF